jgi:PIN domain-containing protein
VKFFFDNCISSNLTEAMRLLNPQHSIEHLTKRFAAEALDIEWIPVVAEDPEVMVISGDPTITKARKEKEVWRESGLTGFFFGGALAISGSGNKFGK